MVSSFGDPMQKRFEDEVERAKSTALSDEDAVHRLVGLVVKSFC